MARVDLGRGARIVSLEHVARPGNIFLEGTPTASHGDIGGWFELLPNAGPESFRPPVPQHGDLKDARWRLVETISYEGAEGVVVAAVSTFLPILATRSIVLRGDRLEVRTRLENLGRGAVPYLMGQHITFGPRLLDDGFQLDLPDRSGTGRSVTRLATPDRQMVFAPSGNGHAELRSSTHRVVIDWDVVAYPAVWLWVEEPGATASLGALRALAVEPQSALTPALDAAIAAGEAPLLEPGRPAEGWVTLRLGMTDQSETG